MRPLLSSPLAVVAILALGACGEADLAQVGRNAAWSAVEAANPELSQGLKAAQILRQAAATCGWSDVDAAALARIGVAGIEEPMLRAAAESLAEDLLTGPVAATGAPTPPSDCTPETRRALEAQVAAMAGGGAAEGGGGEAAEGGW